MAQRPPMPEAHRRRFRAVYELVLDYYHQKQRAAQAPDAPRDSPLTDRLF